MRELWREKRYASQVNRVARRIITTHPEKETSRRLPAIPTMSENIIGSGAAVLAAAASAAALFAASCV